MPEYAARFADVLAQSRQSGSPFTGQDAAVLAKAAVSAGRPLVVFLDTGEIIADRAWGWLRRAMTGTGPGVAWVIGARFETEAEAGADSPVARFVREIGDARLMLMSPARFDDAMIRAYLEGRLGGPGFTDEQVDMIARFTRGLPLAVSLTATLLGQGQQVGDVCREADHGYPGSVVSSLARRYLVHAERQEYPAGDPRRDDVMKILGLALAYGDVRSDPDLLAALWDITDPLAAFTDLARRHDFVLPVSRRLHDDAEQRLLGAIHLWVPRDRDGPRAIYDLLSDPPLPGIDRLRAIIERQA